MLNKLINEFRLVFFYLKNKFQNKLSDKSAAWSTYPICDHVAFSDKDLKSAEAKLEIIWDDLIPKVEDRRRWKIDTASGASISLAYDQEKLAREIYQECGIRLSLCENIFTEGDVIEGTPIVKDLSDGKEVEHGKIFN